MSLLSVAEAHSRLLDMFEVIGSEKVGLSEANGRVLAEDVVSARLQPPFAASGMDGYAVQSSDASPGARLRVIGESLAGCRFDGTPGNGEAVRIFTGAPVPDQTDKVIIQENVTREADYITIDHDPGPSNHIRPAGADFDEGTRFRAPRLLTANDLALLAAMNAAEVCVTRRPVVAIIPTGDELVQPGETPGPDQIISSNNFGIRALLENAGAEVRSLPIAKDTPESLTAAFSCAAGSDMIVTLGGASVGDYDLVRQTALGLGLELNFHKIAMRPGKPLMAGRFSGTGLVGLPGNPVSAMVCCHLFVLPVVRKMLGLSAQLPERFSGKLVKDVGKNGPREHYMRSVVLASETGWSCSPFERQDSALLSVLAESNALLIRPPDDGSRSAGETVEFIWA